MNTLALMSVVHRLNASKPVEFDVINPDFNYGEFAIIRDLAGLCTQMRTLLSDPNLKRLKA
jgi:hypothetical protein